MEVFLRPISHPIPPHSIVDRQTLRGAPAILRETARVVMAEVVRLGTGLIEKAGYADEKVREVVPGFLSGKSKSSVEFRIGMHVDLLVASDESGLQSMRADDLRKDVVPGPGVVELR